MLLTHNIIDPLHSLIIRKVDPGRQVLAAKQPVQILVAHVFDGLSTALLLQVPPALTNPFPEDPGSDSQANS